MNEIINNQALINICSHYLKNDTPNYGDLNNIISFFMSGITCSMRFPGQLNTSLRKLAVNLTYFPDIHFFVPGYAPFLSKDNKHSNNVFELIQNFFWKKSNMLCDVDPRRGSYSTSALIFRGKLSIYEIDQHLITLRLNNLSYFVSLFPHCFNTSICNVVPKGFSIAASFLGNTTASRNLYQKIDDEFNLLFRKKAFLHYYLQEGMEEFEFSEAESYLNDFIAMCNLNYIYENHNDDESEETDDDEEEVSNEDENDNEDSGNEEESENGGISEN